MAETEEVAAETEEAMAETEEASGGDRSGGVMEETVVVAEAMVGTEVAATEETGGYATEETEVEGYGRRPVWLWRQNGRKVSIRTYSQCFHLTAPRF